MPAERRSSTHTRHSRDQQHAAIAPEGDGQPQGVRARSATAGKVAGSGIILERSCQAWIATPSSRALGVYHYGPLRRSDWLPTGECEDEHVRPGEDLPADWDSESEESDDEFG